VLADPKSPSGLDGAVVAAIVLPAAAAAPFAGPARAQNAADVAPATTVELDRREAAGGGCRLTLVVANPGAQRLEQLELDPVLFDVGLARRLTVETWPVRPKKTVVRQFEAADLACAGIGRLRLDDVAVGAGETRPLVGCVDRLATALPTSVPFAR
jgi:hypothetical protein